MNKEELIEYLEGEKYAFPKREAETDDDHTSEYKKGFNAAIRFAKLEISQLDEPEKVVVPQFVAKYIEIQREYGYENIRIVIKRIEGRGERSRLFNWFFFENNSDLFAKAWLYGYVVEETLYYMPLPYQSNSTIYYYKQDDGKISFKQGGMMKDHSKFTQEELDKYFPEIKHMAEEVQE